MITNIVRKFLIKDLPDLSGILPIKCKKCILYKDTDCELMVQKVDKSYEFMRKTKSSDFGRDETIMTISQNEFEWFAQRNIGEIERDEYDLENNLSIKIYHGKYSRLIRAEIDFESEEKAKQFKPFDWMGKEISDSQLGRDASLIKMSDSEFKNELSKYENI